MSRINVVKFGDVWLNPFYIVGVEPQEDGAIIRTVLTNFTVSMMEMAPDVVIKRILRKLKGLPL